MSRSSSSAPGMPATRRGPDTLGSPTGTLADWQQWQMSLTDLLLALDGQATSLASAEQRQHLAELFVARTALSERIEALAAAEHDGDRRRIAELTEAPVIDSLGTEIGANFAAAADTVTRQVAALEAALGGAERAALDEARTRSQASTDLAVAERLSTDLGSEARRVASLTERLRRGDQLGDVAAAAAEVRRRLEALDANRVAALARLATADGRLAALRTRHAEVQQLAERCRAKIVAPPRLAVPSVDALGLPPAADSPLPWSARRAAILGYLDKLDRLTMAFDEAARRFAAPLDERDQLRGLLQAFRDKAAAAGRAEGDDLDRSYRAAADLLWSAPCDLIAARGAVDAYIVAVNAPHPQAEQVDR